MDLAAWLRAFGLAFRRTDPVDGSLGTNQGIRGEGARMVFRLSGIGTAGAKLQIDKETCEPDPKRHHRDTRASLRALIRMADQLTGIRAGTGRKAPSLVT